MTARRAARHDTGPMQGPLDRLVAWLYTGPLGHLVAGASDWAALLGRYWWARVRGRL